MVKVGKKYGVSDNAVRKWLKKENVVIVRKYPKYIRCMKSKNNRFRYIYDRITDEKRIIKSKTYDEDTKENIDDFLKYIK